jgi:hypothetical protein
MCEKILNPSRRSIRLRLFYSRRRLDPNGK